MRLAKCLMAAAVLVAGMSVAKADTYSTYRDFAVSWNDGGPGPFEYAPPLFDSGLGTLTGMNIVFSGVEGWKFFSANEPGLPQHVTLNLEAGISLIDDGFAPGPSDPGAYVADAGSLTGNGTPSSGSASGLVYAAFDVPTSFLSDYTTAAPAGIADGSVGLGVRAIPGPGFPLPYESYSASFDGTVTSIFTYDPRRHRHDVPEPGSLALLGTALAMLAGILSLV